MKKRKPRPNTNRYVYNHKMSRMPGCTAYMRIACLGCFLSFLLLHKLVCYTHARVYFHVNVCVCLFKSMIYFLCSASDEPIIIPESEGSPAAAVHARSVISSTSSECQTSSTATSTASSTPQPSSVTRVATIWQPPLSASAAEPSHVPVVSYATGTNAQSVQGPSVQVPVRPEVVHMRKSPISSRTRSRARPGDRMVVSSASPNTQGLSFPQPASLTREVRPHPPGSWPFVPQTVSSQVVTRPIADPASLQNAGMSLPLSQLPSSPTPSSSSPLLVSPTDQHYQSRRSQHVFPVSGAVVSPSTQQPVYQMHFDSNTGRTVMMPVPIHKQVIHSSGGSHIFRSGAPLGQFVPAGSRAVVRSPTSPSMGTPSVQQTVSPNSSSPQHISEPTFPPARYILRPSRSRSPPPYPSGPLSPVLIQHPTAEPLPLSAAVRPDLSIARRLRKTSFTQQFIPPQVNPVAPLQNSEDRVAFRSAITPLKAPPSEPASAALVGTVESPIVIEDMEDPLATDQADKQQHAPQAETADRGPTGDKQDLSVPEQETGPARELAVTEAEIQLLHNSRASRDATDAPSPSSSSKAVCSEQQSEGMEVEMGEGMVSEEGSSGQDSGEVVVTLSSKPPSTDSTTIIAVSGESLENHHEVTTDSGEADDRLGDTATEESVSSCQPGPALLESKAYSGELAPGNYDGDEQAGELELDIPPQGRDGSVAGDGDTEKATRDSNVSATSSSTDEKLRKEAQSNDVESQALLLDVQHSDSNSEKRAESVDNIVEPEVQNSTKELGSSTSATDSATEKQSISDAVSTEKTAVDTVLEVSPVHALKDTLAMPATPTNITNEVQGENLNSPKTTPGGILKYTSQFDTPTSAASKVRRVQFANNPVVFQPPKGEEESFKTPKPCMYVLMYIQCMVDRTICAFSLLMKASKLETALSRDYWLVWPHRIIFFYI